MTTGSTTSRRRVLAALAATGLAGCLGDSDGASDDAPAGATDATDTPAPGTTTDGLPTQSEDPAGDTSPSGSCAVAFGDTDRRYEPGDRELDHTFLYPLGGEVVVTDDDDIGGRLTRFGYPASDDAQYEQYLSVRERIVDDGRDAGAAYAESDSWSATTVTYEGRERTAAVNRVTDTQDIWIFSAPDDDATYEFEVFAEQGIGDACPDAYHDICHRVANSFEPR
ncbi:hypothetical protein [Haloarchaeobius iranensis]|uniref:Uncharacterized protein n=1 Tax=Haloarchaeobius iranensis TaxID=996166 RepID=A0A1G9WIG5_9EURY|nr:hypothetical protein [Haloarchaeobius iranensis]SDM83971.1 hypothetical protein SAMN05192554_10876 [Haloarchaeobius iranensis]